MNVPCISVEGVKPLSGGHPAVLTQAMPISTLFQFHSGKQVLAILDREIAVSRVIFSRLPQLGNNNGDELRLPQACENP